MSPEVRALLEAVLEAIDIPAPATAGDQEEFYQLLDNRVLDAVVFLHGVLGDPLAGSVGEDWHIAYLRKQLAKKPPTTYRHYPAPDGGDQ